MSVLYNKNLEMLPTFVKSFFLVLNKLFYTHFNSILENDNNASKLITLVNITFLKEVSTFKAKIYFFRKKIL